MAVRDFTDSEGVEWRVWDVTPLHMHPATRTEDYMGNLQDGWLVFESEADKRRLEAPYPADWTSFPVSRLEALCRQARPVIRRMPSGQQAAIVPAAPDRDATPGRVTGRTFTSPRGRQWTVGIHERAEEGQIAQRIVLRFSSGDTVLDLTEWPEGWSTATVSQYAMMLLDATPPRRVEHGAGPQRRLDDRPAGRDDASIRG